MNSVKKNLLHTFIIVCAIVASFSCIDDRYDLSQGISTDILFGGDYFAIPLGATDTIFISQFLNPDSIDMLEMDENGVYRFAMDSSITKSIDGIKPISFKIGDISVNVPPISFEKVTFPNITLPQMTASANLPATDITMEDIVIPNPQVDVTAALPGITFKNISDALAALKLLGKTEEYLFSPQDIMASSTTPIAVNLPQISKVKTIKQIKFTDASVVSLTIDLRSINKLTFKNDASLQRKIDLTLAMPTGFVLEKTAGDNVGQITGSTYRMATTIPLNRDQLVISFKVKGITINKAPGSGPLITGNIGCDMKFSIGGTITGCTDKTDAAPTVVVTAAPTLAFADAEIETEEISNAVPVQTIPLNVNVTGIPKDLKSVDLVALLNSKIQIKISPSFTYPLTGATGGIDIYFPAKFKFNPSVQFAETTTDFQKYHISPATLASGATLSFPLDGLDLSKNAPQNGVLAINEEIKFGGSLTFPSQAKWVKSIGGLPAAIAVEIPASTLSIDPDKTVISTNAITSPDITTVSEIKISQPVPEQVKNIQKVTFAGAPGISVSLQIIGLPAAINKLSFSDDFAITFPPILKMDSKALSVGSLSNGILSLKGVSFNPHNKFIISGLKIGAIDFGKTNPIANGNIEYTGEAKIAGKVIIEESTILPSDLKEVNVKAEIKIDAMEIADITGIVGMDIETVNTSIQLGGFGDIAKDIKLDIKNPSIALSINNPFPLSIKAKIQLIPYTTKNKVAVAGTPVSADLTIEKNKLSNIYLHNTGTVVDPKYSTYEPVALELRSLMTNLPDSIKINFSPKVVEELSTITMASLVNAQTLKVDYAVNIPLDLGREFSLSYTDSTSAVGFNKSLVDYADYVDAINIVAKIENALPIDLMLNIIPLDVNGADLSNEIEVIISEKILAGTLVDGKPMATNNDFEFKVANKIAGKKSLNKLDGFKLKIGAGGVKDDYGTFRKDQFLKINKLIAKIPGGLKLNLDQKK